MSLKKLKPYFSAFLSFAAGGLLSLAFAPYQQDWLAFLSPMILLYTTESLSPKKAFKQGFIFGCGFFGFSVYWVFHSIYYFGQTTPILAYLITGTMIAFLSLYPAFMMLFSNKWFKNKSIQRACVGFPALWVLLEMLRGYFLTGFPWGFLGTTQIGNAALRAYAPIGSVWMVSWMVLISAGILYSIIVYLGQHQKDNKKLFRLAFAFALIWILGGVLYRVDWTKPENINLEVALIQGNIAQRMRWAPEHVAEIMNIYETQTKKAFLKADVIIWPEGAIPLPLPYSTKYFKRIEALAVENQAAVIAGVPQKAGDKEAYYNALIGLGLAAGTYYKERLVPFGEFVPFESLLRGMIGFFDLPMSSFIEHKDPNQDPLTIFGLKVAPTICYEIAFPTIVQKNSYHADFIITVSNDTWFGNTIGPAQHLEIAKWRAIETGRYVLRATNTGLTAIIDPKGHMTVAPQFEPTILYGTITPVSGNTPWVRFGVWPLLFLLGLSLFVCFLPYVPERLSRVQSRWNQLRKNVKKKKRDQEKKRQRRNRRNIDN